ncbi:hypothetical protein [Plantactinospora endophytica]|uniref:Uncharacterized protein n=1 Tax=Plantactinospora endophytica TaxID=673535 RepID=A0ABQ4E4W7_9ACTN|nr:hypothetical protein [Plantactinospora endophytica]GIG89740.1 hypothetical protein Pen02_46760 [Plantactinospora endophytica]
MSSNRTRRLTAGVLGAATAVATLAMAPAAQAAPRDGLLPQQRDTSVTVGRLVLEPTDRGYRGSVPLTISYRGTGTADLSVSIVEPVAGAFEDIDFGMPCFYGERPGELRRNIDCWDQIQGGDHRTHTIEFEVLTETQAYAMSAAGGAVTVTTTDSQPLTITKGFDTVFRSTTGSLRNPRPYVQDTQTDASVAAGSATLVRQPDGSYLGRLPVTVRYEGDAPHDGLQLESVLPAGVQLDSIEPSDVCAYPWCSVPGGEFMQGEERSVELVFTAPVGTTAGDLGTGSVVLHSSYFTEVSDVDPSDNTTGFTITAVDGAA